MVFELNGGGLDLMVLGKLGKSIKVDFDTLINRHENSNPNSRMFMT